jgi:putative MATE family efflux protein
LSDIKSKENKMGVMPVNKLLLSMSAPMMASMLVQALYNVVDSIFVSWIDKTNDDALTAVSLAFPAQSLMIAVAVGTGVGVNALLSRRLGAKDFDGANKIAGNGLFLAACSYLVFLVLGLTAVRPFFAIQTNVQSIVDGGTVYLSICMCFSFGLFFNIMYERLMQSTGKTVFTMYCQGVGALVNIVFDPIFIFGYFGMPKMGVAGAAVATVAGQICSMLLSMFFHHRYNREVRVNLRRFRPSFRAVRDIYAVALPSIIMQSIGSVMVFGMNKILIRFTETAATVFGVYFKLQSFVFMPVFGLNNGMVPIIGYNYGAGKRERIIKTIRCACIYAVCIMFAGLLIMQLIPRQILMIFNASDNLMSMGVPALRIISLHFMLAGIGIVLSSVFQALGHAFRSMLVSIARQIVVLLPAAFLLSLSGSVNAVWWAFPIAELVSVIMCVFFYFDLRKKVISRV